jgi:DNA-binding HxlR family transcriptional regulator
VTAKVTQRMLTLQLRELEADGVIHREVHAQVPPRVDYSLTEFGTSLRTILGDLRQWGTLYVERQAADVQQIHQISSENRAGMDIV